MTMKLRKLAAILFFLSTACSAEGDEYSPYLGITELNYLSGPSGPQQAAASDKIPYFGGADYEYLWPTEFDDSGRFNGQHLTYRLAKVNFGSVVCYNKCNDERLAVGLTYTSSYLRWNQNPYFKQRYFDQLNLNL